MTLDPRAILLGQLCKDVTSGRRGELVSRNTHRAVLWDRKTKERFTVKWENLKVLAVRSRL